MTADRVGVVVRAVLIAGLGLAINEVIPGDTIDEVPAVNILVYYGVFFLLAIPFLFLSARALFAWAGCFALAGPVLMHVLREALPGFERHNPVLGDLLTAPAATAAQLLLTGTFPALPYLAYLLAGLALGRLDLGQTQVQARLVVGGVVLAAAAWVVSWVLIQQAGGFEQLVARTPGLDEELVNDIIVWGPEPALPTTTWWWLAVAGPYTNTPPALLMGLGSAAAVPAVDPWGRALVAAVERDGFDDADRVLRPPAGLVRRGALRPAHVVPHSRRGGPGFRPALAPGARTRSPRAGRRRDRARRPSARAGPATSDLSPGSAPGLCSGSPRSEAGLTEPLTPRECQRAGPGAPVVLRRW